MTVHRSGVKEQSKKNHDASGRDDGAVFHEQKRRKNQSLYGDSPFLVPCLFNAGVPREARYYGARNG